jgi:hypothetical protein
LDATGPEFCPIGSNHVIGDKRADEECFAYLILAGLCRGLQKNGSNIHPEDGKCVDC